MSNIKKIITNDNSPTCFSETYQETYHSTSGAVEEAQKKFSDACKIKEFAASHDEIYILDVCFGLGYNSAVAIDNILSANPNCKITIVGLENDMAILDEIKDMNPDITSYPMFKKLVSNKALCLDDKHIHIKILLGDAREKIKETKDISFNFCFLDPFSPKVCPELWTEEFFKDIYSVMAQNSVLATYSCARIVRDNLKKAGFEVKDGPIVGRRAPATIAAKG
jgi:tRNA U34 5-methylaminomethyl-2-thiouridine-forming methyltransferase MnmC